MLGLFFNIFDYINSSIVYCYYIYIIIYKLSIYFKFHIQYFFNFFKYYITINKVTSNVLRFFHFFYYHLKKFLLWFNRRYLKKRKRFRIYYKYHNIRYWKFLLFLFYINVFLFIWKKRNLYRKSQIIFFLIFLHISILITSHFFIGLFNSFDLGILSCILFMYIIILIFRR